MRMSGGCRTAPWFTAAQFESGLDEGPCAPPAPPKLNDPATPVVPPRPSGLVPVAPAVAPVCGELGLNAHPTVATPNAATKIRAPTPVSARLRRILHSDRRAGRMWSRLGVHKLQTRLTPSAVVTSGRNATFHQ